MHFSDQHPAPIAAETVTFEAALWRWTGGNGGAWFFLTIGGAAAEQISAHALMRRLELGHARGFGSVRVEAGIGSSRWRTSIFPNREGTWILPIKAAIRRAEDMADGDCVSCEIALL